MVDLNTVGAANFNARAVVTDNRVLEEKQNYKS
jgi:hypothetical protein